MMTTQIWYVDCFTQCLLSPLKIFYFRDYDITNNPCMLQGCSFLPVAESFVHQDMIADVSGSSESPKSGPSSGSPEVGVSSAKADDSIIKRPSPSGNAQPVQPKKKISRIHPLDQNILVRTVLLIPPVIVRFAEITVSR